MLGDKIESTNTDDTKQNSSKSVDMCQIIFYDFSINKEIESYLNSVKFNEVGTEYNTLAIIGPQSTGKSTLLNGLFDTKFEVMNSNVKRGQTTKGVWISAQKNKKVLIIDCEGTDSKNRTEEERGKFEHASSLFALALSDVLMINMWTSDVGRYTASNYGVLKIVFEMNLKLFEQEFAKKILIILRDFDPKRNQKDKIESLILEDIHKIWDEIKKPEKFKDSKPENFFSFEFITLSHKIYLSKIFKSEVEALRDRLNKDHKDYIFQNLNPQKNIPSDGLNQYINQLWNDILNEKELDIPSQREMLANYRCSEIKNNILKQFEPTFKSIHIETSKKIIDKFKEQAEKIRDDILAEFDKIASNYEEKIYRQIRKQLDDAISQKFYVCFLNQTKLFIPIVQRLMRRELSKKMKEMRPDSNYMQIASTLRDKHLKMLLERLKEKKVFDSWNITEKEYSSLFDEIIDVQKKKSLSNKKQEIIKVFKKELDDAFFTSVEGYKGSFWPEFNKLYLNYFFLKIFPLRAFLIEYYNNTEDEVKAYIEDIESNIYNSFKKGINKKLKDITQIMIDVFKNQFWYESKNQMRNWNRLEEKDIDSLFKTTRSDCISIFDNFKTLNMISTPLSLVDMKKDKVFNDEIENEVNQKMMDSINNDKFEDLLRQSEINGLRKKFEDGITLLLEDAKRRKEGFSAANLPYWFYVLLIFFGYDDLFMMLKSKIGVAIFFTVASIIFGLIKYDKMHIVKGAYYDIEETIAKYKKKVTTFIKSKMNKY